jgi:MFS family permease
MEIRFPMWLRVVDRPGAGVFAVLSGMEAFSRALIAGVLPLEAYRLLETAVRVSEAYAVVGAISLVVSLLVPLAMRKVRRKWVFSAGCLCMVAAPLLLVAGQMLPFLAALQFRSLAVVFVNIALNLYILDYIRRKEFLKSEPRRLAAMGFAWCTGPGLGIWLYSELGALWVFVPSAVAAFITLCYFWYLRMQDNPMVAPARNRPPSAFANIRRFVSQPRMRLAWVITFSRSCYWTTFFVYPPLAIVQAGGDPMIAAVMLSAGQGLLFLSPVFGRAGGQYGIRRVIIAGLLLCGAATITGGLVTHDPWLIALLFFIAAGGSAILDAVGNIPFLRAVHSYERAEMTSVFRTYIEVSQLLPQALYTLLLFFLPLNSVFFLLGAFMISTAWLARWLPKRL